MIKSCNKSLSKSSEVSTHNKTLSIQPIKLKSINQERLLIRSLKLNKSLNFSLTDQKFEKQLSELEGLRIPRNESKFDMVKLKNEITNATSKALEIANSYSLSKKSLNLRSSRRLAHKQKFTFEGSPLLTERASCSSFFEVCSFKVETPKMSSKRTQELQVKNRQEESIKDLKSSNLSKENIFIAKVRQATLKLREMRKKLYQFI